MFERLLAHLNEGKTARSWECDEEERELMETVDLLSLKPVIYAANMDEDGIADFGNNAYYQSVKAIADAEGAQVLPICARTEQEIGELDEEDKAMFLEELGLHESGLDRLIKCSYALLGLISFSPAAATKCAPGPSPRAPRPPRRRARSTPTSSAASSARR